MGFRFENGDQCFITNDDEGPFFGGPEIARQLKRSLEVYAGTRNPGIFDEPRKETDEAIHLRATSNRSARVLIAPAILHLLLLLPSACDPIVSYRFR